jgi:hypothetical protein
MFTGQLNCTDSSKFVNQVLGRGNPVFAGDSDEAFALRYRDAPSVASPSPGDNQYSRSRAAIDNGLVLPATDDYGGPDAASGQTDASGEETWQSLLLEYSHLIALGSGALERQFNDQDNELESPDYGSGMDRATSQKRTVQVEPVPKTPSAIPDTDGQPETSTAVLHKSQFSAWMSDKTPQHPYGHIEMYDGRRWVSDFMQHSFSPYRDAASTPPLTIYRLT